MDLIDRQAAIDKINERQRKLIYCFGFENDVVKTVDIVKSIITAIPSAQPEIIRCRDCKHYNAGFECLIEGYGIEHDKDHFCGYAERRTDERTD